jgi:hypothetical protein
VNHDQIKKVEMILGEIKGQGEKKEQESRGPEEDHSAFEQLNVLIVIAFHIHSSASPLTEHKSTGQKPNKGIMENTGIEIVVMTFRMCYEPVKKTDGAYLD